MQHLLMLHKPPAIPGLFPIIERKKNPESATPPTTLLLNLNNSAYIYILTNPSKTSLYIGITPHLKKRITDRKNGIGSIFAKRYNINQLVYIEEFELMTQAIRREKELKKWKRILKEELISTVNPAWRDLAWDIIYS